MVYGWVHRGLDECSALLTPQGDASLGRSGKGGRASRAVPASAPPHIDAPALRVRVLAYSHILNALLKRTWYQVRGMTRIDENAVAGSGSHSVTNAAVRASCLRIQSITASSIALASGSMT